MMLKLDRLYDVYVHAKKAEVVIGNGPNEGKVVATFTNVDGLNEAEERALAWVDFSGGKVGFVNRTKSGERAGKIEDIMKKHQMELPLG